MCPTYFSIFEPASFSRQATVIQQSYNFNELKEFKNLAEL